MCSDRLVDRVTLHSQMQSVPFFPVFTARSPLPLPPCLALLSTPAPAPAPQVALLLDPALQSLPWEAARHLATNCSEVSRSPSLQVRAVDSDCTQSVS